MIRPTIRSLAIAAALAWLAGGALAAETAKEPTAAQRKEMADVHRQMATCLESDRPMSECRAEMKRLGDEGCPMREGGMTHGSKKETEHEHEHEPSKP
jgi:hypothetical protein